MWLVERVSVGVEYLGAQSSRAAWFEIFLDLRRTNRDGINRYA